MDTKKITTEYRLIQWAGIMQARSESGQTVKAYCESAGIHENTYYYWQHKLREAASQKLFSASQNESAKDNVPNGWTQCAIKKPKPASNKTIYIRIGKCTLKTTADIEIETLTKMCGALVTIC